MAAVRLLLLLLQARSVLTLDNGLGMTPPRGWRSWNAFGCDGGPKTILTQAHMQAQMLAVVDQSRTVDGRHTSLADLGFDYVSMDDGWQRCNCSSRKIPNASLPACPQQHGCFNGGCSFHDKVTGKPLIKEDRFPDMKGMVDFGHSLGLKVGTYLNNCICMEAGKSLPHYEGDVEWMTELGFDEVKVDGCGTSHNVSRYAELFNASGRPVRVENCHNSWPDFKTGACPMNFFRSGGDIGANIGSILGEAYSTVDAADLNTTRSRPGCWAYPDMSEVGNFPPGPSQVDMERTHWGLWCIVSSPLILGFDMNNSDTMDRVWPIITNKDALAVSEAWAGHPGTLIRSYLGAEDAGAQVVQGPCDGSPSTRGWHLDGGRLVAPRGGGLRTPQCLNEPRQAACPPPTTYASEGQCGLLLTNCTAEQRFQWTRNGSRMQYLQGGSAAKPQCLYALPLNFNVATGYFVRQAATMKMMDCPKAAGVDIVEPLPHTDAGSECSLVKRARAARGGTRLSRPPLRAEPSQASFNLTAQGELRTAAGLCLKVTPLSGIQLWAKPLNASSMAALFVNPLDRSQKLRFPLTDLPSRFHGTLVSSPDFACAPGRCAAWEIWAREHVDIASGYLAVDLKPLASAFYVFHSDGSRSAWDGPAGSHPPGDLLLSI